MGQFGRSIVLAAGVVMSAGCDAAVSNRIEVGAPAPEYGALDLAGDSVQLAALEGRVVLLNVWATWCIPCREEIPALQSVYEEYGKRGLELVGVSVDGRREVENIRQFAESYGVTYTLWHDPQYLVGTRFRIVGVPTTFLIDKAGTIRWLHLGPVTANDPALQLALQAALESTD